MKWLILIFFICILMSCAGSKKVVGNTDKTPQSESQKEDIVKKNVRTGEIIKITDSLYVPQDESNIEIIEGGFKNKLEDSIPVLSPNIKETDSKGIAQTVTKQEKDIHKLWDELLQKHVSENGNVNYKVFKKDHWKLQSYIQTLGGNLPEKPSSKSKKLAFWINAYNALTIDLILRHYPIQSIKDIKDPWGQRHWKLGEKWYNLEDIEHEILRKMNEPRIHFAIVCASYSCPKLQNEAFQSSNLEAQLSKATKDFLNDPERNSISQNNLELSKIFQWFAKDFKQEGSLIDFLNTYSEVKISKNAKKRFKDYNWDLNE